MDWTNIGHHWQRRPRRSLCRHIFIKRSDGRTSGLLLPGSTEHPTVAYVELAILNGPMNSRDCPETRQPRRNGKATTNCYAYYDSGDTAGRDRWIPMPRNEGRSYVFCMKRKERRAELSGLTVERAAEASVASPLLCRICRCGSSCRCSLLCAWLARRSTDPYHREA